MDDKENKESRPDDMLDEKSQNKMKRDRQREDKLKDKESYARELEQKRQVMLKMAEMNVEDTLHPEDKEEESLADQVRVVSPGQMVLKRFFRSKLSMIGLVTIVLLFLFSFLGPLFSPWGEVEVDNTPGDPIHLEIVSTYREKITFDNIEDENEFVSDKDLKKLANIKNDYVLVSRTEVDADGNPVAYLRHKEYTVFEYTRLKNYVEKGYNGAGEVIASFDEIRWECVEHSVTYPTYNAYDKPSWQHWLGTDDKGMDIFTRLMYGGRISLSLSFLVVILEGLLGILLGGVAGYFGRWADQIIMRIVDFIYCLPNLPLMLVISSVLDGMGVDQKYRIYYLMVILCLLGWAGVARMVRGQILYLREQEFMLAAEATGLSPWRKIIKHLIPNVMPQLIVSLTLGLGSIILTESTLSYLGLGIPVPYAAWGTMISRAKDPTILQYYANLWVPPGIMIVLAVLAFNFVGDGLRDAFDPKARR